MNILMMSKILYRSGVGSHIIDLCTELKKRGHNVWIVSRNNEYVDSCERMNIPFIEVSFSMNPKEMKKELQQICGVLRDYHIDIVHCHHRTCSVYMKLISILTGVPFVWTNHANNIPHDFLHRVTTFYGKKAICVSTDLKQFCMQRLHIPESKIEVVYNGINPENYSYDAAYVQLFKTRYGICDEKIISLFGRMSGIKNHGFLLEAVARLSESDRKKLRVVFFGGTQGEYVDFLKTEIERRGLQDIVIFGGYVTPSQAMSVSDLSVLPSLSEGFAIASIESFVMHVPHIRTKVGGYRDMADCCIGIELGDVDGFAGEIKRFLKGGFDKEMIEHAYQAVYSCFTIKKMTDKVLEVYEEAIK